MCKVSEIVGMESPLGWVFGMLGVFCETSLDLNFPPAISHIILIDTHSEVQAWFYRQDMLA